MPRLKRPAPDAVVIGAGPAGAVSALCLARRGLAVMLVDRAGFPRPKLCGGCLAEGGQHLLTLLGLCGIPALDGAPRITTLRWRAGGSIADLSVPGYRVIDRSVLDQDLVNSAVDAGAIFSPRSFARVPPGGREVLISTDRGERVLRPAALVVADGLKGASLRDHPAFSWRVRARARVGIGSIARCPPPGCGSDAVTMACGPPGYAGVAPLGDGRAIIAAAVDPAWLAARRGDRPLPALLRELGLGVGVELGSPEGAPGLTRGRAAVEADNRLFVCGDAGGYIEPFTGEGMTWAIEDGVRVSRHVADAIEGRYRAGAWTRELRSLRLHRGALCRATAALLRRPGMTAGLVGLLGASPALKGVTERGLAWFKGGGARSALAGLPG
jgi:flavin-dependent dehydrogenase